MVFPVNGQKIVCNVTITPDKLPQENQMKLSYLKDELQDYTNNYEWTENEFDYEIECELELAFSQAQVVSYEDRYTATLVISNGKDQLYADKRCTFPLQEKERLVHSSSYHPFTSLIDFYFYLLIGYEYDKLYEFGGDEYYQLAKELSISSKSAIQYYKGWDRREDIITGILDEKNRKHRLLMYNYYTGYYFYEENDFEQAEPYLLEAVKLLKNIPPDKRDRFLQLNYKNFNNALIKMQLKDQAAKLKTYKS
jgi:hypothetical protein